MGRLFIKLDPAGWERMGEPGAVQRFTPQRILAQITGPGRRDAFRVANLWNPPNSGWLLPRPKQFAPDWYKSESLGDYVLTKDLFTFAGGIDPNTDIDTPQRVRTPDGFVRALNKWLSFTVPEDVDTSFDSTDFDALRTLCGLPDGILPDGFQKVAYAVNSPNGNALADGYANIAPWVVWEQYPAPHDWICFGFGELAVLVTTAHWYLLRALNPDPEGKKWELIRDGSGAFPGALPETPQITTDYGQTVDAAPVIIRRSLALIPVGFDSVCLSLTQGVTTEQHLIRVKESEPGAGATFGKTPGSWWVAAAPKQSLCFQMQVIGYETGESFQLPPGPVPAPPEFFDLGANYQPAETPLLEISGLNNVPVGGTAESTVSGAEYTSVPGGDSNEVLRVAVRTLANEPWPSDGQHHEGALYVLLKPDHVLSPSYLAPQLRWASIVFPETRVSRPSVTLELDDTEWEDLTFSCSLREILGKRMEFYVSDRYETVLGDLGLDVREGYPVEVWDELTPGDEESRVLRVVGWMYNVECVDQVTETDDIDLIPLRRFKFDVRGVMTRGDEKWPRFPEMIDPSSADGIIEHATAVQRSLRAFGLNDQDPALCRFYADPYSGTDIAKLPSPGDTQPDAGLENEGPQNPDWHETPTQYIDRIAQEFRGWQFYEGLRQLRYHPDLSFAVQVGEKYRSIATFYRTAAEAAAAGHAGQWFIASPTRWMEKMRCNVVQIFGKTPDDSTKSPNATVLYIDRNDASLNTIDEPEDFIGDERIDSVVSKLAVGRKGIARVARVRRYKRGHRKHGWRWTVKLFPWEVEPQPNGSPEGGIDVGHVVTLAGRGDLLLVHCSVRILGPSGREGRTYEVRTTYTGEKLPRGATADTYEGNYPGQGLPVEV